MLYVLAAAVSVLALCMYLPQAWHLLRSGSAAGVSRLGLVNSWVSSLGWGVYLVHLEDWPMFTTTIVPLLPLGVTLWYARRNPSPLFPAVLWASVLFAAWLVSMPVLGAVLSISIVLFYGPAAVEAWRSRDRSGISRMSWSLALAEASLSAVYGVLVGNWAIVCYGSLAAVGAALVLAACLRRPAPVVQIPIQRSAPPASASISAPTPARSGVGAASAPEDFSLSV